MSQNQTSRVQFTRRRFLRTASLTGMAAFAIKGGHLLRAAEGDEVVLPFANGKRELATFPQKRPLILLTSRPPQLETPFSVFNEGVFTPNDAFFVRYHLAQIPTSIDPDQFRLEVKGKVNTPLTLSLQELKTKFEPVELAAVNQCSGNSRGFSNPRVAGGQLANGAMGCAKWKGVRLKDILAKAGVAAGARQVTMNGLDTPVKKGTPDFIKALDIDHALDGEPMVAYSMNDADLPMLNGFPLKVIVPGYFGTYWVKHVNELEVVDTEFPGFWMSAAYRIPDNAGACVEPGATPKKTIPIARFNVRSFITSLADGAKIKVGERITVRGIAFDGGYGITSVELSDDGGHSWHAAQLGQDYGKYAFREWTLPFTPGRAGDYALQIRATNRIGQSQPSEALWNPAGYMRNVIETVRVTAA